MAIHEDSAGVLWIATYGGGLNRFDPQENTFKNYTVNHGLPNNILYAILEDDSANLWISSNCGLTKFDPESESFHNFNIDDGLQGYEFNSNAALKLKNGQMLFGGLNGYNAFHPQQIWSNSYVPPVYITDIKLFNRSIGINQNIRGKTPLQQSIHETAELEFSYKDNSLMLEFAALNYWYTEKNQYRYIMENLDKEWTSAGSRRFSARSRG